MNLGFVMSATSGDGSRIFKLMKDTIKIIATKYGTVKVKYTIIVYGRDVRVPWLFKDELPNPQKFAEFIIAIPRAAGGSALDKGLERAKQSFQSSFIKQNATNILIVLTDSKSTGDDSNGKKMKVGQDLDNMGVEIITVGIGPNADRTELETITPYKRDLIVTPSNKDPQQLANQIMGKIFNGLYSSNFVFVHCMLYGK